MYLGVGFVVALMLVLLSPAIWVAWWLLADLDETASTSPGSSRFEELDRRRAA